MGAYQLRNPKTLEALIQIVIGILPSPALSFYVTVINTCPSPRVLERGKYDESTEKDGSFRLDRLMN